MEKENTELKENTVFLMKTQSGNGVKICVDGNWLYTSVQNVEDVMAGTQRGCSFGPYQTSDNSK